MDIYNIDELGTMHVEEIWQMRTNKDTEIYKEEYNLGNINITNFQVRDEDRVYTEKSNWNINDSFENKKYKYGINYVSQGLELCWGISEYGNKTYTISYDLENAVFNTEDSQVLYLRLINDLDFPPENFNITISGPEYFQDTLDVWGYGYKGYAYVDNGKIYLSNEENTSLKNGEYVVLLVKFPLNTFNVDENNTYQEYQTFNDVLEKRKVVVLNTIMVKLVVLLIKYLQFLQLYLLFSVFLFLLLLFLKILQNINLVQLEKI